MRQFIHFAPDEALPSVGDTVQTHSQMSDLDYETTIERIVLKKELPDGRIRLTIDGTRREVSPSNVIPFSEHQ